jgi:chloramphenicol O-acetyltransferase
MTFYYWGKYTKKEGELVLSLCSLSKGAASSFFFAGKSFEKNKRSA